MRQPAQALYHLWYTLELVTRDERSPEIPVRFYRPEAGESSVLDWLRSLDKKDRRAIGLHLMRVQFG
ncbi:MAG: hypothetical protein WBE37_03250 [Bryobacteraceae bacterium]